ncbi:phage tail spike protein [Lacticaseibacillus kribbianus]|uniref:phage tail spike protein n=1 Tax=Lacticaseibacillus kribbianus TaxID=2926292 RepID=UPI001CD23FED
MDFYITDRKYNLLAVASTDGTGQFYITDDVDTEIVPQSVGRSYAGTINFAPAQIDTAKKLAEAGNYLLYQDDRGRYVFATMMETELNALDGTIDFTAENGGVDLINDTVGAYKAAKAMTIADYLAVFTWDSGFDIGINEVSNLTRTLEWEGEETALARVEAVAANFDAELDFRFEVTGLQVVKRYIDIYKKIGDDKGERLEVNTHINSIVTTSNIYDLYTSVIASGDTPEGKDAPITLKGYKWTDPDGRFTLKSDGILRDSVAVQLWSRTLSNANPNPTQHHIQRVKTYTAKTQAELLQSALADLKKYNHATVNYTVDLAYLPDGINVGDTVHLVDEAQDLNLSARLLELKTSYANGTRAATFGDYLIEANAIDPELRDLANTVKILSASAKQFPWVRYADDDHGTGISALPEGKSYMAVVWGKTATPSDDPADYAGKWQKVTGEDGATGEPGKPGEDGRTPYFHKAYANSVDGKNDFSLTDAADKAYLGTYADYTQADSTDSSKYIWQLTKGEQGPQGPAGKDITSYASGTVIPSTVPPANSQFWLLDGDGIATKFYKSDGTKWVEQPISASAISAATFNGLTFNGVRFNGSKFVSSFSGQSVDASGVQSELTTTGSGTATLGDGYLVIDGKIDDASFGEAFHTEVGPSGAFNRVTSDLGMERSASLTMGELALYSKESDASPAYVGTLTSEKLQQINNADKLLWSGSLWMLANHVITPTLPLDQCQNGWKLLWSRYTNGAAADSQFATLSIPKFFGAMFSGKSYNFSLTTYSTNKTVTKMLYVTNTTLQGHDTNGTAPQNEYTLRAVLAD